MRSRRLMVLVLAIGLVFLLASCSFSGYYVIPPIPPSPPPITPLEYSSVTVISRNDDALGYIYLNGENTGEWLSKWGHVVIEDVPCYYDVSVRLYIPPWHFSHVEYITPVPEEKNFVYFYYW